MITTAAERDQHVFWQRHTARQRDRGDVETDSALRWELRAQVRAGIAMFRAGQAPRPDLVAHRWRHSDAIRREICQVRSPLRADQTLIALRRGFTESDLDELEPAWTWDDIDWSGHTPLPAPQRQGRAVQQSNHPVLRVRRSTVAAGHQTTISRLTSVKPHADREAAALAAGHPALVEARTLFPSTVADPETVDRLLVSGHNSAKIGKAVRKGPWRGFPIFTLTLEERATCPTSCGLWRECYGNAMHMARRHRHGPALIARLWHDMAEKQRDHPRGFAIRAHVLGDFWNIDYVHAWHDFIDAFPALHVWGYTAHPSDSPIGRLVGAGNQLWPDRWAFRFSVDPNSLERQSAATTIWRAPEGAHVEEGLVCPAQTGATAACATCGLCWAPAAMAQRIVFVGHGMQRRGKKKGRDGMQVLENPPPQ